MVAALRLPVFSIALLSATALGYEVLLMRLFSIIQWHHFAYMIISLALLGYGASGTFIALGRERLLRHFETAYWLNLVLFGLASVACYSAAQQIPFNPEEVLWDWHQAGRLMAIYLLLALPFFFAANGIALALTRYTSAVARLYAADLLGAGLGSLAIVALLFQVFPDTALKLLGALGLAAALLGARELRLPLPSRQLPALAGMLMLLALPAGWLELQISPYKGLPQMLRISGTQVVAERSSPLGKISVVKSDSIPFRHAPGLSLHGADIPAQLGLFIDADGMTVVNHNPRGQTLDYLDQLTSALPYHLASPGRVLILGAGGGSDIQQALNHHVAHIDAVELDPELIDLVGGDYADWSGHIYRRDGVQLATGDARGFIRQSRQHYDLIQISMLDAFGASSAGLHALNENYLYTVEALQDYLAHLAPGGYLGISRWIKLPPRDTLKLFATAVRALQALGSNAPGEQLVLIRGWQTSTLLIKNGRFSTPEIDALHDFCSARAFDLAWYSGMEAETANRFNILARPYFFEAATALVGADADDFIARYKFDITPATDDRPYFAHFLKWEALPEILALRGQGGLPLLEAGYLVLLATLLQAALISVIFILLPLAVLHRNRQASTSLVSRGRVLLYFFAIGLAFLFVEIAFMQKFILFLHHPLYAVATVLAAFLVFAGLGSAWTARSQRHDRSPAGAVWTAVAAITVFGSAHLLLSGPLLEQLMPLPLGVRIGIATLLIAPLAFFMGMPFPLGLARVGAARPALVPWAWGINGCASVLSAVLATLLAIQFGFSAVVLAALLLYLVAALAFP